MLHFRSNGPMDQKVNYSVATCAGTNTNNRVGRAPFIGIFLGGMDEMSGVNLGGENDPKSCFVCCQPTFSFLAGINTHVHFCPVCPHTICMGCLFKKHCVEFSDKNVNHVSTRTLIFFKKARCPMCKSDVGNERVAVNCGVMAEELCSDCGNSTCYEGGTHMKLHPKVQKCLNCAVIERGYDGCSFPVDATILSDTIWQEYPNKNRESVIQNVNMARARYAFVPRFTLEFNKKRCIFNNMIDGINFQKFPQIASMLGEVWVEETPPKLILELIENRLKNLMRLALWNHDSPQQVEEIFRSLRALVKDKKRADEMIESLVFLKIE